MSAPRMAVKLALVVMTIDIFAVVMLGQGPLPANDTTYLPGVLAPILISPVVLLTKTSPAGAALNVPPDGLFITGVGFGPVAQNVPEGYWNWGSATTITDAVTGVRALLLQAPVVFCT